ncbi:MAG: hypothetical protein P794_02895 [Epsilonproteobacteria bacterium (ex Lamellibrachia satsuma)]|nr:MAG: hypothetical protein P794_02895 [Epsilonproteobacteria bacterium (ex Lamellibrachia satsuma)]
MQKILYSLIFIFLFIQSVWASYPTLYEQEPNDTPAEATPFSGSMILTGMITEGDQDAFMWKIGDEDSQYRWNIKLIGIPNALTRIDIMKIKFTQNGKEVEDYQRFFSFGTKTGNKPVTLKNLFFDKGEYLVAISSRSNMEKPTSKTYQVILTKERKVNDSVDTASKEEANSLDKSNFDNYLFKKTSGWFKFNINQKESQKLWTLKGTTTIGHQLKAKLTDEEDNEIAQSFTNKFGKFKIKDLELDEGVYYLHYEGDKEGTKNGVLLYSTGNQKIDEDEVEPNNETKDANAIDYKKTIHGTIDKDGDEDYFTFSLPKKLEDKLFSIKLDTDSKDMTLYLEDNTGKELQRKTVDSNYTMPQLMLQTDTDYKIQVYGSKKGAEYTFKFSKGYEYNATNEAEPNDNRENSYGVNKEEPINGHFTGYEWDCYHFSIEKANRLWNISAAGAALERLKLSKGNSNNELFDLSDPKDNRLTLKNLLLLPGLYKTCVIGTNGAYTFTVKEASLSDLNLTSLDDIEHEPNQDESQTNALAFGQTIKGMVEHEQNEDYFHFTLNNYESIRLTAIPPKEGDVRFKLKSSFIEHSSRPQIGQQAIIEGIYPPGRYIIELWSEKPSYQLYSLKLERLNPFESIDVEPNDNYDLAYPLPLSFNLKGHSNSEDEDFYTFPAFMKETNVTISGDNLKDNIRIYPNKKDGSLSLEWDDENKTYTTTLKTPQTSYIAVEDETGFYDYNLSFTGYEPKKLKELDISLKVDVLEDKVATYSEYGQKVTFNVAIENLNDEVYELSMDSHISDNSWKLDFDKTIHLESKEKKTIPLELVIPKNVSKLPVVTTLKFMDKNGSFKTTSFEIKPKDNAKVINPYEDWGMPTSILGGLNVARLDFGAKRVIEHNETELGHVPEIGNGYHLLFDDIVYNADSFHLYSEREKADENVTIELMGDEPSQVVGVILNPLGEGYPGDRLKDFSISLSENGKEFKHVYKGTLGLESQDQVFTFDKSYLAKYARLTLHNSHNNKTKDDISLGEWKVIAKQESIGIAEPFNIANPKLGGHVVHASKELSGEWDRNILTKENDMRNSTYLHKKLKELSWVVGFKNERVAKITDMVWREPNGSKKETYVKMVKILVSAQTPNGPWEEVGDWHKSDNNESSYHFKKATWARYVKFAIPIEKTAYYAMPEELRIFEEKPGATYASILGEWGKNNHKSFYEYQQSRFEKKQPVIVGNGSKEKAFALDMNQTVRGRVSVANHEKDWYKIIIPKDHNELQINLSGKTGVDVNYELFDSNDSKVAATKVKKNPLHHTFTFEVTEGEYYLKVKQPPVSVIFAWDNSGSVSPYHTQIFNSVNNYIRDIQPKIDAVNLICFNDDDIFLLSNFSDRPTQIQTIFNNFDRDCSDSDAERPLKVSSEKLKNRDGIKGVIIIGDAVGSRDMKLWDKLKEVKPKVFAIRVVSQYNDNEIYEGIMQSWSRVNNGTYAVVNDAVGMSKEINKASAILRRPVYYTLNVQSRYERPLGPGSLQIVEAPENKKRVNKNFAIELILDASGSMLKRIKGKRRISIAKDVLKKAVTDIIPPKTLVALRVFGHKKADSCRTDLEMRLQPLNPGKTIKIIRKINAKNLAKTPIADSLEKVAIDLSKVKGKKVVILVTDGKETCDGDPAKVITSLKEQGIDVRINIVGFAINDEKLKEQFKEWARLGDGGYFDASDKKSLNEAVKKALQIPYKVYDNKKNMVAEGIIDSDPIKLKGGTYKVVIKSSPEQVLENVIVIGEQDNQITFKYEDEK